MSVGIEEHQNLAAAVLHTVAERPRLAAPAGRQGWRLDHPDRQCRSGPLGDGGGGALRGVVDEDPHGWAEGLARQGTALGSLSWLQLTGVVPTGNPCVFGCTARCQRPCTESKASRWAAVWVSPAGSLT